MAHRRQGGAVRPGQSQRQALLLPGNTHPNTVAGWGVRHDETLSGLVESPVLSNGAPSNSALDRPRRGPRFGRR